MKKNKKPISLKSRRTSFGLCFLLPLDLKKHDIIVLCSNDGYGLRPISVLLPHQIYKKDLTKIAKQNPAIKEFVAIPASSNDYITIKEL